MFVVLAYDVNQKRVGKIMKLCKRYLHRVQNSVFEGELTQKSLDELKHSIQNLIDVQTDGVRIYKMGSVKYMSLDVIGSVVRESMIV